MTDPARIQRQQEDDRQSLPEDTLLRRNWFRLVRFGFRLLYNEMAWTYDGVSWLVSLGQWRRWQSAAIPSLKGSRILELAHGPGHMLIELNRRGFQVFGYDLSPYMSRLAKKNLRKAELSVPLARGDARALPFARGSFDSVLTTFPTEFVVDVSTLSSLHRVLKPGGRLVIVPQARLKGGGPVRRALEWLFAITGQRVEPADDSWLARVWKETEQLMLSAGFVIDIEQKQLEESEVTIIVASKSKKSNRL